MFFYFVFYCRGYPRPILCLLCLIPSGFFTLCIRIQPRTRPAPIPYPALIVALAITTTAPVVYVALSHNTVSLPSAADEVPGPGTGWCTCKPAPSGCAPGWPGQSLPAWPCWHPPGWPCGSSRSASITHPFLFKISVFQTKLHQIPLSVPSPYILLPQNHAPIGILAQIRMIHTACIRYSPAHLQIYWLYIFKILMVFRRQGLYLFCHL